MGIDPFLGGLNNDFLGSFGGLGGLVESFGGISGLMKANEGVLNMLVNSLTIRSSSTEYLKPQLRDNAKRVKLKYGPIRIKGSKTNVCLKYSSAKTHATDTVRLQTRGILRAIFSHTILLELHLSTRWTMTSLLMPCFCIRLSKFMAKMVKS